MTDFIESYMCGVWENIDSDIGFDERRILLNSMRQTLKLIIENELSGRQYECLNMFYNEGMSQESIAKALHISQPTVSRHIATAKSTINRTLGYCYYAVDKANNQWLKLF
ncbi:MAG: sigma-70 family RNA polymerase sigma factor [Eubacterium sp.]|nr:sigma-70 family RNA polymerase sigma factor [Eubacterium sp.]